MTIEACYLLPLELNKAHLNCYNKIVFFSRPEKSHGQFIVRGAAQGRRLMKVVHVYTYLIS